jgi:hypothetical protein
MPLPTGLLLDEALLQSAFVSVLASFVAVNTVIYATLAIIKLVPILRTSDFLPGRKRRSENRSIYSCLSPRRNTDTALPRTPKTNWYKSRE